jgi:DNA-binding CsgD family transcriptional regulator
MRSNLERAVEIATTQGRIGARCEALARLAVEAARLGAAAGDEDLLALAETSATEARSLAAILPGHPAWGPESDAALATVLWQRGDRDGAVARAMAAINGISEAEHEDAYPTVILPAGEIILEAGPPEAQEFTRTFLQVALSRIVQGIYDESVRVRWLKGPIGSRFAALAGDLGQLPAAEGQAVQAGASGERPAENLALEAADRELLLLMTEGLTNGEMAERLGVSEASIATRLAGILASLGASDRAQATTLAMRGLGASLPQGAGQGLASS